MSLILNLIYISRFGLNVSRITFVNNTKRKILRVFTFIHITSYVSWVGYLFCTYLNLSFSVFFSFFLSLFLSFSHYHFLPFSFSAPRLYHRLHRETGRRYHVIRCELIPIFSQTMAATKRNAGLTSAVPRATLNDEELVRTCPLANYTSSSSLRVTD